MKRKMLNNILGEDKKHDEKYEDDFGDDNNIKMEKD
jgi:hypothetical protein